MTSVTSLQRSPADSIREGGVPAPPPFDLSIVIPTRNEARNIDPLVASLARALVGERVELIFVDDSDDGTPEAVRRASRGGGPAIRLIHRPRGERAGGLSGAVVAGLRIAHASWICVMDGDLQHPAEAVPRLLARARMADVDVVVGTRDAQRDKGLNFFRRQVSKGLTWVARALFPLRLRHVSDPMSGFFIIRRLDAADIDSLQPRGFKILFELIVRHPHLRVGEVHYTFQRRLNGASNAGAGHAWEFVTSALQIRLRGGVARLARFGVVGLSGIGVNLALTGGFTEFLGVYYLVSAILATQGSTLWNFALLERWVFADRRGSTGRLLPRFLAYAVTNNAANTLRVPLLWLLTSALGVHYLIATFGTLLALFVLRYSLSTQFIWPQARRGRQLKNA